MFIKSLAHIAIRCKDVAKSLHFYCDILGLTKAFDIKNDEGKPLIEYIKVTKGQFIELFYPSSETPFNTQNISYQHLCLEVFDIFEACREIEKRGGVLDILPKEGRDGNWQAWIVDPDGNRIELMQIMENSLQAKS